MKLFPLLLIPLFALALPAHAQDDPDPSGEPSSSDQAYDAGPAPDAQDAPRQKQRRVHGNRFGAADTNGDGKISRTEAKAMPFVMKRFDAIDTDHDGYVTRAELRAEHQRMQAARAQQAGNSSGS